MSNIQSVDISEEITISEPGYQYLESMAKKLNKKASKWGVPPIEINIIKTEDIPIRGKSQIFRNGRWEFPTIGYKKNFTVQIIGKSPKVEGFEFIAKIQHTPEGNLLNYAPESSIKQLPPEYRTAHGDCDICKQKRERFNTFILQLTKPDIDRFPDKKSGDFIMVGSSCLERFLPGISVNILLNYAKIIETMRQARVQSGEFQDDDYVSWYNGPSAPNNSRHHMDIDTMLYYISATYIVDKKFVSKTKSRETGEPSTTDTALGAMFDRGPKLFYVNDELKKDSTKAKKAAELAKDVGDWMKTQDFNAMALRRPDMVDYFHNLQIISRAQSISWKNIAFLGGIFSSFLRKRERDATTPKTTTKKDYIGKPGEKVTFTGKLISQKYLSGGTWGDSWLYKFQDDIGNDIIWFSTRDQQIDNGQSFKVVGTVKRHEIGKFTNQPQTLILRAKLEKI